MTNEEIVQGFIDDYLKFAFAAFTFDKVVELYVDQKLGFAKLKEEYKKENPDIDPDEIDKAVDEERSAAVEEFTKEGSSARDELKKKYDEFKTAAVDAKKNVTQLSKEFIKGSTEAVMPNVVGPVAPNPFSVALKVYNLITRFKRLLDRVIISMQLFMTAAKALGINETEEYDQFMGIVAGPIKAVNDLISKKEADSADVLALEEAISEAKKEYKTPSFDGTYDLDGNAVEKAIADEFELYTWPLKTLQVKKLTDAVTFNKRSTRKNFRGRMGLEYQKWYKQTLKQLENSSSTTGSVATGSTGGDSGATFSGDTRL